MPRLDDLLGIVSLASAALLFAVALQQPLEDADLTAVATASQPVATAAMTSAEAREALNEVQASERSRKATDRRT